MEQNIFGQLKSELGKIAWVTFQDSTQIRAGILEIDRKFETVKLLHGKASAELHELQKRGNVLGEEERAIIENPANFSVFPIKNIKEVISSI